MSATGESDATREHILSRFDCDLDRFRRIALEMGQRVTSQVKLVGEALTECDAAKARKVIHAHRRVRDLDIDALQVNAGLYATHQPLARDLRLVLTLSRAVYDLERIGGEAVRLADIAEALYCLQPSARERAILEDVGRLSITSVDLLERAISALDAQDVSVAVSVALDTRSVEDEMKGALRRLATFIMEDPRNIRWVIEATLGVKGMERIADHACSIARNLIYSVTGKDVRHVNAVSLDAG